MATLRPFHGLLPSKENAKNVSAVPYDVVNSEEAATLAKGNPLSFLRVSRPEIELRPGVDVHDEAVYAKALENFKRLIKEAPLTMDTERHLYLYQITMDGRAQTGILGTFSADEYFNGTIKKHEKTRQDKEDDRARHVMDLRSQTGPVFLCYKDNAHVNALVHEVQSKPALFDFLAEDHTRHVLWRIPTELSWKLHDAFQAVDALYIADGHHRAAAGCRAATECRRINHAYTGDEEFNFFMAVAFPVSELKILAYNRLVKDLNGHEIADFMTRLSEKFTLEPTDANVPKSAAHFQMYLQGQWYALTPRFELSQKDVIEGLDVSILQDEILAPILGIDDPRTSQRIDFVGGIRGTSVLEKAVDSGNYAVAFSMFPTSLEQLMDVADAGEIMPPKSTWFEPKLRDGLVCHNF